MKALLILAFGAFIAQTSEYLPISLLPQIAHAFQVSDRSVGGLVTGYAWIAALTAVPFTIATIRFNRKALFLVLLSIIALVNLLAAFAPNFLTLVTMRVVMALTHGVFWSILASIALQAAPAMPPARAMAWVFSGISLAGIAGIPLAALIGNIAGWRIAFVVFAGLGAVGILGALWLLPSIESSPGPAVNKLPRRNSPLYGAAIVTFLIVSAHFASYTYVVPVLESYGAVPASRVATLLLFFGVAGATGSVIAGWLGTHERRMVAMAAIGLVLSQAVMLAAAHNKVYIGTAMLLWGASVSLLITGLQSWAIQLAPEQADAASSLYVAAFNLGIGSGALLGGLVLEAHGAGSLLKTGIATGGLGLMVFSLVCRASPLNRDRAHVNST